MNRGIPAESLPPQDMVSEQSVIGGILAHNPACDDVADFLKPKHFYFERFRMMYAAAVFMVEAGTGVDMLTLRDELLLRGQLEAVGGELAILECAAAVPHAAHIRHYGENVFKLSRRRSAIAAGQEIIRHAFDLATDIEEALASGDQRLRTAIEDGLSEQETAIATQVDEVLATADEPQAARISTGLPSVDGLTGGMSLGALIIVAARTSMGKSALMLLIMRLVAEMGIGVLMVTLEMTHRELIERFLAAAVGCQTEELWHQSRRERVQHEAEILKTLPMDIDATMPALPQMLAKMRVLVRKRNVRVIVVDYLQLVESGRKHDIREQEVAAVTRALKKAAQTLGVVMIVASQLNREVEKRTIKRPMLSDLRESGAIEQDADQVWLLHRPNKDGIGPEGGDDNYAELIVAKNRNGRLGSINLDWHGPTMRFRDRMIVDPAIMQWEST